MTEKVAEFPQHLIVPVFVLREAVKHSRHATLILNSCKLFVFGCEAVIIPPVTRIVPDDILLCNIQRGNYARDNIGKTELVTGDETVITVYPVVYALCCVWFLFPLQMSRNLGYCHIVLIAARYYFNERGHIEFGKFLLKVFEILFCFLLECCNLLNQFFAFFFAFSLGKPAFKQFCIVIENLSGKCHYRLAVGTRAIRIIGVPAKCIHICMYPEVHSSEHININKIFSGHLHHRAHRILHSLHNIHACIKNHDIIAAVSYKQRVTFAYKK